MELAILFILFALGAGGDGGGLTGEVRPPKPSTPCPDGFHWKLTPSFVNDNGMRVPAGWTCVPGAEEKTLDLGTGELAPVTDETKTELAKQACAMLSTGQSFSIEGLATQLAKAAYPAVTWPPPPAATASHRGVGASMRAWVQALWVEAVAANKSLCDFLREGPSKEAGINLGAIPTPTPTPGRLYTIRGGDNLLKVTGQAYGIGPGGTRLTRSIAINDHPTNANLRTRSPAPGMETSAYPSGVISFGVPFQTIFIPTA